MRPNISTDGNLEDVLISFARGADVALKTISPFESFITAETLGLLPAALCAILWDGKNFYLITWLSRLVASAIAKC